MTPKQARLLRITVGTWFLAAAIRLPGRQDALATLPTVAHDPNAQDRAARDGNQAPQPGEPPPRLDSFGDPLPPGAIRRLGTLRFRHGGGGVHRLFPCPDGKTLVSDTFYGDRTVRVWELATGKLLRDFPGSYDCDTFSALSSDGKTLAVGQGNQVALWDLDSGKEAGILQGRQVDKFNGLAFAPDGKTLAAGNHGTIHFFNLATQKPASRLVTKHSRRLSALAWSQDGKSLAAGDDADRAIEIWDVASRQLRHELTRATSIQQITFSPDGALLAAGSGDGTIPLWDGRSGKLVHELQAPNDRVVVAFSPDGNVLASAEYDGKTQLGAIGLWDVASGKELRRLKKNVGFAWSIAFSRDGKTLILGGAAGGIHLLNAETGEPCGPLSDHVGSLTASPDGRMLAHAEARVIRLLETASGREVGHLRREAGSLCLAFSQDGKRLAEGINNEAIHLWDVPSRVLLSRLKVEKLQNAWLHSLAFAPDDRSLAVGDVQGNIRLLDLTTGQEGRRLALKDKGDPVNYFVTADAVAFAPDGRTLAASGRTSGERCRVRIWEIATGREQFYLTQRMNAFDQEHGPVDPSAYAQRPISARVLFSPDGKMLTKSGRSKALFLWEAASGAERLRLEGHADAADCVAFAPDGRTLASASWDQTIRLWDLETGAELRQLKGHRGKANTLAFVPDGKTLISCGDDATILFWDVAAVTRRERLKSQDLTSQELEKLWSDLADADAGRAYQAMGTLGRAAQTVSFLQEHLPPADAADDKRIAQLLADLDGDAFAVRKKAAEELAQLGAGAEPALRKALQAGPTAEVRLRVEQLLERLSGALSPEQLRPLRALEVLERIGTPAAQSLLKKLAGGAPEARLTREARDGLERLTRP